MKTLRPRIRYAVLAGFLAGLILKYFALFYKGVFDMDAYYDWGKRTLDTNLAKGYGSIYFPLQYQIFEFCVWIQRKWDLSQWATFKSANLFFDVGIFIVLLLLLKRERLNPAYALLYWLHPWFISVFSLGYVDFQFSFFVLTSIYLLRDGTARRYLLAGIPIAAAFLMKPQVQILMVAAFIHAICHAVRTRKLSPFAIFAGPVSLFLGYEVYFAASGISQLGYKPAYVLPGSYLTIVNVFPSLTAQMPNIWYPVAYFLKKPGAPSYTVSDQILLLPHVPASWLAAAVVLILLAVWVWWVERQSDATIGSRFIRIFGMASLLVPMFMTSAHENHMFLGTVFLVLFIAMDGRLLLRLAAHILIVIQFLNVNGIYGEHWWPASFLRRTYSEPVAVVYAVISVLCFAVIFGCMLSSRRRAALL